MRTTGINNYVYIYGLVDPIDNTVRYIGKSNNPNDRLIHHLWSGTRKRTYKECWINSLQKLGLKPNLRIIKKVNKNNWENEERFYINLYKKRGYELTNGTEGGEGSHEYTEEMRMKSKTKLTGRVFTEEHKRNIGKARKGKIHSEEAKRKISEALKGRDCPHKGKVLSKETKLKMSNSRKGGKRTEETKLKMSISSKARYLREKLEKEKLSQTFINSKGFL